MSVAFDLSDNLSWLCVCLVDFPSSPAVFTVFISIGAHPPQQAEFSEINLVAHATGSYSVDIEAVRNGNKVTK